MWQVLSHGPLEAQQGLVLAHAAEIRDMINQRRQPQVAVSLPRVLQQVDVRGHEAPVQDAHVGEAAL